MSLPNVIGVRSPDSIALIKLMISQFKILEKLLIS